MVDRPGDADGRTTPESGAKTTLESVVKAHETVFSDGLGKMSMKAHLTLKPDARPVYRKARPVPYALMPLTDKELERWITEGVAGKVDPEQRPSGWGTPLVPVLKPNGQVRLCANYSLKVNPLLRVDPYPLPAPEDLFANIRGRVFAKLDFRRAYEHMELDETSRDLTTVTTHRGSFRMVRMPYDIASCGFLFQQAMDKVLEGLPGCVCYIDDVLIAAEDGAELVTRLDRVLTRLERHGLRLERSKCTLGFGLRSFSRFLFGRKFTLTVDDRALSRILSPERDLPGLTAARLQRIAMELAAYQYSVELRGTADMALADSLSRMALPCSGNERAEADREVAGVHLLFMDGVGAPLTAREIENAIRRDPLLAKVLMYIRHGWPTETEPGLAPFRHREVELSTDHGVVLWGGRAVIPQRLRSRVLQELHIGHLGSAKMKGVARRLDLVHPSITRDVQEKQQDQREAAGGRSCQFRVGQTVWARTYGGPDGGGAAKWL
ncbi:uncharacterized protein K02A2.6-like [Pollicipes pollicipes]|uniref:uncharacterized protein K02A2.6-like n=1 Tax=Pollicipes pollicipes TaxID=41117 RepID=UPI001885301C|nr:uncharacterized protein K02A2.6-like [Pollicipes pollicipes]